MTIYFVSLGSNFLKFNFANKMIIKNIEKRERKGKTNNSVNKFLNY